MNTIITEENTIVRKKKKKLKKAVPHDRGAALNLFATSRLLTQTELFNNSTISFDISCFQVVE